MSKIFFDYSLKKDAWSWVLIANQKNLWGLNWRVEVGHIPDDLLAKIEKSSFSKSLKIVEDYIEKNSKRKYKEKVLSNGMHALEKTWKSVEKEYFKILSNITERPIFTDKFGCYTTTGFMCPYNEKENWFMVSMWHCAAFSITTICHEIMHLQFLHYYGKYLKKKGLTNDQVEDLKEALTFLLNEPEFDSIILSKDYGYPEHKKLRKKLSNIWSKNKNFQNLIDEGVEFILKNK